MYGVDELHSWDDLVSSFFTDVPHFLNFVVFLTNQYLIPTSLSLCSRDAVAVGAPGVGGGADAAIKCCGVGDLMWGVEIGGWQPGHGAAVGGSSVGGDVERTGAVRGAPGGGEDRMRERRSGYS